MLFGIIMTALFSGKKLQKITVCPKIEDLLNKLWYTQLKEYFKAIKVF